LGLEKKEHTATDHPQIADGVGVAVRPNHRAHPWAASFSAEAQPSDLSQAYMSPRVVDTHGDPASGVQT